MSKIARESLIGEKKRVAYYLFPFWERVDMTLNTMCTHLGYKSHTNLSAVRSGAQRVPLEKADLFIKLFEPVGLNPSVFVSLLITQHFSSRVIKTMTKAEILKLSI
tara:strand:- start:29130 stop:29447 length:318 start_codon:yes stop_codon:yes gene_type:complete